MITHLIPLDIDIPDVEPDFDAPWLDGVQVFASYFLATALVLLLIALIAAGLALGFHKLASDRVRTLAGENIMWIFIATCVVGAASGIFQWFINFDFGF